jgi:CBS domain-containing protein
MATRTVRELMTRSPTTVRPDLPVAEAARVMRSEDVGSLPVVDGARLVGMITDRDIALRIVAEGKDPESTQVGEIQSTEPVVADPDQGLDDVLEEMARHRVRRVPVVDEGLLVGIVAQADVARKSGSRVTGNLVKEVSEQE